MTNWMRKRAAALLTLVVMVGALAGCSGSKAETKQEPAPAAQTQAPAPVDKGAVIKEAAVNFFSNVPANSNMIDAADVKKKVDAKDATIYLLDIRKAEDFAAGHIEGATNIPFGAVGANIDKLPKDKQIIVNCYSGQTSGQTVGVLKTAGYNAISVKGGFPSFEKAGFAIKK